MSWVARKVAELDNEDYQQVIKEYFAHKEQKLLQEKQLMEFWKEYEQDERGA